MNKHQKPAIRSKRADLRLLRFLENSNSRTKCGTIEAGKFQLSKEGKTLTVSKDVVDSAVSSGLVESNDDSLKVTKEGLSRLRRELYPDMAYAAQHSEIRVCVDVDKHGSAPVLRNDAESPLKRLYLRKDKAGNSWIDDSQYAAGERLRRDFETAQLQPSVTANWSGIGSRGRSSGTGRQADLCDFAIDSRKRVAAAIGALDGDMADLALDVCCFLKGFQQVERERQWPPRSAKLLLRSALSCLAAHYGIGQQRAVSGSRRILHWGDGTHRPSI